MSLAAIFLGTFASEDLTCIAVGLLVQQGQVDPLAGLLACFLGIYVSDLGLWLLGWLASVGLVRARWLRARLPARKLAELGSWFDRRGWVAVIAARFLPGTRWLVYVAAGLLGRHPGRFALWSALAALAWTPVIVLGAALFGEAAQAFLGTGWLAFALAALGLVALLRFSALAATPVGRGKLFAAVSRLWRWEFWPGWLFYLPLLPWLGFLALRYRSFTVWTAANPGIPHGGVVGESKSAILQQLPAEWTVPTVLVPAGDMSGRLTRLRGLIAERGWDFPLILKPDAGQRGAGVRRAASWAGVEHYLAGQPGDLIVQPWHPGPFEAGIFYYRLPGEAAGRIFSITDKVFPVAVGDGEATLEELVWGHPRYRMQARVFLARHDGERGRVLAAGEPFSLALAGNHCQGTLFRDGAPLWTLELEQTIDTIAQAFPGFHFGRFDVRYGDVDAFRAGRDLNVVELNGVTSESTNLYDPSWSLLRAYRMLAQQWALLFRIGHANRCRGERVTGLAALLRLVGDFCRGRGLDPLAD
jgi:membrane protein DedA with SNARE-associated domain